MSAEPEILAGLPDAAVVLDSDGGISYMNPAAERLSGWTASAAAGKHYGEVFRLRDAAGFFVHEHYDPFGRGLKTVKGTPERDYLLERSDGKEAWVALRSTFERDDRGRITRVIASIRDTGRRHRLERSSADLISTVSHEIRSPLTSVKGFTSTLLHRWEKFNDEQKQHMLRTINADADRVTRLLTDLLDVSRLEAGRLELRRQEVHVPTVAAEVMLRLRLEADDRPLEAEFPENFPRIWADPNKVEQVLINLVENAIKYAGRGSVRVTGESDAKEITVRVTDEGDGIDARHVPLIFQKFYRRSGERSAGTGLGLFICNGIVLAHGGRIWVDRSDETGSVFAFTLPIQAAV